MAFRAPHEIYSRRFGRNVGVAVLLVAFVALVFGLTFVKVMRGEPVHSLEYVRDPGTPVEGKAP
ncbi:MAG: hypothetical protein ACRC14_07520 [Paracoccaceae bacterium]